MMKTIKSYEKYGDHYGIAKQVQGRVVDAELGNDGKWHYMFCGEKWIASDYAFEEEKDD